MNYIFLYIICNCSAAYDELCSECSVIFSGNGHPNDIDDLISAIEDEDTSTMFEIFEDLGIEGESLPAMMYVINQAGDKFHGGNIVDTAKEWIDNGFNEDEAEKWIKAGFFEPSKASLCVNEELDPDDLVEASESLIEKNGRDCYVGRDPIYAVCNSDLEISVLIEEAKRILAES